jgi:hypothetical protein
MSMRIDTEAPPGMVRQGRACIVEHPTRGVFMEWDHTESRPRWSWARPRTAARRMSESAARDVIRQLELYGHHGAQMKRWGSWEPIA